MDKINFRNGQSGGTPLNASNMNLLQDNVENAIDDIQEIFLENETEIGTWIDSKPLYRKVFKVTDISGGVQKNIDVSSLHIKDIVSWNGSFIYSGGTGVMPINIYSSNTTYSTVWKFQENLVVRVTASVAIDYVILIIEYTKTTD